MDYRLYKREKLCSIKAIDRLFFAQPSKGRPVEDKLGKVSVALCYPLRMIYGENPTRGGENIQFLISVPKKRLRKAVDRVRMRRRIREAYRLTKDLRHNDSIPRTDVAFIYVADKLVPYSRVRSAMERLLTRLGDTGL